MKIWVAIIAMSLTDAFGSLLYSKGMKQTGEIKTLHPYKLLKFARRALKNPQLLSGFGFEVSNFFIFLTLLSWADLSLVIPMGSIGYLLSLAGAKVFLKEQVTLERWLGTILIGIGVALVSLD